MKLKTFFAASLSLALFAAGYRSGIREVTEDQELRAGGRTTPKTSDELLAAIATVASDAASTEAIPTGV